MVAANEALSMVGSIGGLPSGTSTVGVVFFGLLVSATAGVKLKIHLAPRNDDSQLWTRMKTWWWIVSLFLGSLALGRFTTVAFMCLVSFLALREHLSLTPTSRRDRGVLFVAYGLVLVQYALVYAKAYDLFLVVIPAGGAILLASRMAANGEARSFGQRLSTIHFGLLLTVYNLSHIAYLTTLGSHAPAADAARPTNGAGLIVFLVAMTQLNDVFQYIWGRSFGRRKVSPTLSPNKTVAGLVGGVLTTSLVAAIFGRYLTPLDTLRGAAVGLAIGIAGFLGDLTESALKRDVGVKDSGAVLPGHGGVFDRVDSLTFTAPVFFHLIRMMYFSGGGQ